MKCHVCGSEMEPIITTLPFKVDQETIIILKELPVLQCKNCNEYLLEDNIMERVDQILEKADYAAELEIIKFAA
ncbi:MAG: type II toxin-antitoxin system MqsA family antitoxin [Deltaproteobacteria bacterium]|nr:type II toxin-antitoxin system MqsA family antitoxin [Deltaproteobacteria bacterium]